MHWRGRWEFGCGYADDRNTARIGVRKPAVNRATAEDVECGTIRPGPAGCVGLDGFAKGGDGGQSNVTKPLKGDFRI